MIKLNWEYIDTSDMNFDDRCYRAKVVGGWLVMYQVNGLRGHNDPRMLVFVPDPNHSWRDSHD